MSHADWFCSCLHKYFKHFKVQLMPDAINSIKWNNFFSKWARLVISPDFKNSPFNNIRGKCTWNHESEVFMIKYFFRFGWVETILWLHHFVMFYPPRTWSCQSHHIWITQVENISTFKQRKHQKLGKEADIICQLFWNFPTHRYTGNIHFYFRFSRASLHQWMGPLQYWSQYIFANCKVWLAMCKVQVLLSVSGIATWALS